jgi:hypothetical protein
MGRWIEQGSQQNGEQGSEQGPGRGITRPVDEAQARRLRRTELLLQRQRAAERRRQRGFGLRLPSSKPLVFLDPPPAP